MAEALAKRLHDQTKGETPARARAAAAGLTVNDYLTELVKRDDVDARGRPVWAPDVDRVDQLPMELTA